MQRVQLDFERETLGTPPQLFGRGVNFYCWSSWTTGSLQHERVKPCAADPEAPASLPAASGILADEPHAPVLCSSFRLKSDPFHAMLREGYPLVFFELLEDPGNVRRLFKSSLALFGSDHLGGLKFL